MGMTPASIVRSTLKFRSTLHLSIRLNSIRCFGNNSHEDVYPGRDYKHWLVIMDNPGGIGATKHEIINCYVKTLASITQSEEKAKEMIYSVSFDRYTGFGCEVDVKKVNLLGGFFETLNTGVQFILPDSYIDPENKDYGGELFVNGEIVERSPERQRRIAEIQGTD